MKFNKATKKEKRIAWDFFKDEITRLCKGLFITFNSNDMGLCVIDVTYYIKGLSEPVILTYDFRKKEFVNLHFKGMLYTEDETVFKRSPYKKIIEDDIPLKGKTKVTIDL